MMKHLPKVLMLATAVAAFGAFAPSAFAVDQTQYEWQGTFQLSPPGSNGVYTSPTTYSSSPACYKGVQDAQDPNYPTRVLASTGQFTCNCDSPISQQPSCPGYTAPTSNTATPGSNTSVTQTPGANTSVTQTPGPNTTATGPSVTLLNPLNSGTSLPTLLQEILQFVVKIGTVVIILMIIYVGFKFVMAQGEPAALTQARQALLWTVVGALILLGAQAIATAIQATAQAL